MTKLSCNIMTFRLLLLQNDCQCTYRYLYQIWWLHWSGLYCAWAVRHTQLLTISTGSVYGMAVCMDTRNILPPHVLRVLFNGILHMYLSYYRYTNVQNNDVQQTECTIWENITSLLAVSVLATTWHHRVTGNLVHQGNWCRWYVLTFLLPGFTVHTVYMYHPVPGGTRAPKSKPTRGIFSCFVQQSMS